MVKEAECQKNQAKILKLEANMESQRLLWNRHNLNSKNKKNILKLLQEELILLVQKFSIKNLYLSMKKLDQQL